MKHYVENLQAGTTAQVIRLRIAFLAGIAVLIVYYLALPYLKVHTSFSNEMLDIVGIFISAICAIIGPFVAWKDPAMTLKMFGGIFSLFFLISIFDALVL